MSESKKMTAARITVSRMTHNGLRSFFVDFEPAGVGGLKHIAQIGDFVGRQRIEIDCSMPPQIKAEVGRCKTGTQPTTWLAQLRSSIGSLRVMQV